jgi:hypothetical protein
MHSVVTLSSFQIHTTAPAQRRIAIIAARSTVSGKVFQHIRIVSLSGTDKNRAGSQILPTFCRKMPRNVTFRDKAPVCCRMRAKKPRWLPARLPVFQVLQTNLP